MSQHEPPMVLNMDDLNVKRNLMAKIGALKGLYEVRLKPRKLTRSLNQNAYYWAAVVQPFAEWLRAEWGDTSITSEQAHLELKRAVLGVREKVNQKTGEVMELMPPSHNLDTAEFTQFIEGAIKFLAETCSIVVLPSELFHETSDSKGNGA
jgi:hypothetical protein